MSRLLRIRSRKIDGTQLLDISLPEIIRADSRFKMHNSWSSLLLLKENGRARELVEEDGSVTTMAIMRDALQEILFAAVPDGASAPSETDVLTSRRKISIVHDFVLAPFP